MTLYITDLDGTLLRSDTSISDYTVETLNDLLKRGLLFSYATARSYSSASPLVKKLDLTCPAVTFNGVFIVDPRTGERLAENVYSEKSRALAMDYFLSENIAPLVYSHINGEERVSYLETRMENIWSYVNARRGDKRLRPVKEPKALFEGEPFYFTIINPDDISSLDGIFTAENGFSRNLQKDTYDDYYWYEIYDSAASKANAVLQVKKLVGSDDLVCFGDNLNDISMIEAADFGIAAANAHKDLKKAADLIINSNDEDGVAKYIYQMEDYDLPY